MRGPLFVSFEGIDGSGKTTQIERLARFLERQGRAVAVFREPGGTALGETIRALVLEGDEVVPWAEASLFAAARAQLVETAIRPALDAGSDVICDRYLDSSVAYQGHARGLGPDAILTWNLHVTGGLLPQVTFLLELSAEAASARIDAVSAHEPGDKPAGVPDRLEQESLDFRRRVEDGYRELAARWPQRIMSLDAGLPAEELGDLVADHVASLLRGESLAAR